MENKVNRKVAFHTLGCKVNIYESEALMRLFENAGYTVVPFDEEADVYVINTCSVTNIADRKSRQMIHRAKKRNPAAVVLATGCYTDGLSKEEAKEIGADAVLSNKEKNLLLEQVEQLRLKKMVGHVRATIKIEDGCNQFCSYCIIPYKRGRVVCREQESILREVADFAAAGHKEIVLTGIHISSYGRDALLELLRGIDRIPGVERIRLGSLEPTIIDDAFLQGLREIPSFCPHFHLSLQSGCDRTLKAMNRHYTTAEYRSRVERIRRYYEHPAITTDVIVGFPGETEEDFAVSKAFVDEMKFYRMHIFPYSRREGTVAARLPDQLTHSQKQQRVDELEEIDRIHSAEFEAYYEGKEVEILTEEIVEENGVSYWAGHTDTYVRFTLPVEEGAPNSLCKVKVNVR